MKRLLMVLLVTIMLFGCAGLKPKPVKITDTSLTDPNSPSLYVLFPSKSYAIRSYTDYVDNERRENRIFRTDDGDVLFISKAELIGSYEYIHSDISAKNNIILKKDDGMKYALTYLENNKGIKYIINEIMWYLHSDKLISIVMRKQIYIEEEINSYSMSKWVEENKELVERYKDSLTTIYQGMKVNYK